MRTMMMAAQAAPPTDTATMVPEETLPAVPSAAGGDELAAGVAVVVSYAMPVDWSAGSVVKEGVSLKSRVSVEDGVSVEEGASEKIVVWRVTVTTDELGMVCVKPESVRFDVDAVIVLVGVSFAAAEEVDDASSVLVLFSVVLEVCLVVDLVVVLVRRFGNVTGADADASSPSGQVRRSHGSTEQQPEKSLPSHL